MAISRTYFKALGMLCLFGISTFNVFSQNEADVERYSGRTILGTARFNALGGAMGALGGDMSAIHINPAGVGVYRFGDVSFTPAVEINEISANLNDITTLGNTSRFVVNNAGLVLANELDHPYWKMLNFAVSYQRLNTFNDELRINSSNPVDFSQMQDFVWEANGTPLNNLSEYSALLAWEAFVIDTLSDASSYAGRVFEGDMIQTQVSERRGNTSDFSITLGGNYNDVLYIGAGLGIESVNYKLEVTTTETPSDRVNTDLMNYSFKEQLATEGYGVNFRIGAIAKLGQVVRVGGSIQTPTTYSLTDNFQSELESNLRNPNETINAQSSLGIFEYRVKTPWRYMASVATIFKKRALLTFQYEFTNYRKGELKNTNRSGSEADFSEANQSIEMNFRGRHTLRGGLEVRATKQLYFRGGIAYFSNPIPVNEFTDANLYRLQYSGGIGYREAAWSLDFSYQLTAFDELYYTNNSANLSTLSYKYQTIAVTLGIRI